MRKAKKRIIISMDYDDKRSLDQKATSGFKELLEKVRGTWPHEEDSLKYVRKLREEWER